MSQQPQTARGSGESSEQTAEFQRTLMENGRKAMRQFFELPLQQGLEFQRSAAELFMNGLEAQNWAQRRGIELTKDTMGNYLQSLDNVVQNAEEMAQAEMSAAQQQGQAMQQQMGQFETDGQQLGGQQSTNQGMPDHQSNPQQSQRFGESAPTDGFQQPGIEQQGQQGMPPAQGIQQPFGEQPPTQQPTQQARQQPPAGQPAQQPPTQQPPTQQPPTQQPPTGQSPAQQPPMQRSPLQEQPAPPEADQPATSESIEGSQPSTSAEGTEPVGQGNGAGRSKQESLTETQ
jgi:hypothetical protein